MCDEGFGWTNAARPLVFADGLEDSLAQLLRVGLESRDLYRHLPSVSDGWGKGKPERHRFPRLKFWQNHAMVIGRQGRASRDRRYRLPEFKSETGYGIC